MGPFLTLDLDAIKSEVRRYASPGFRRKPHHLKRSTIWQIKRKKHLLRGVATLATGVVIVKLIGALYKIPLANILGEEGNSYFTTAYNIYNVFFDHLHRRSAGGSVQGGVRGQRPRPLQPSGTGYSKVALGTFLALGTLSTLIMFFGAELITAVIGSTGASASVRALAFSALFVCCMAAFRGYFQGPRKHGPTSKSQIVEAAIKLLLGLALAALLVQQSKELASAGAILGVTCGSLVALVYLLFTFSRQRERRTSNDRPDSSKRIFLSLISVAIPITIGSSVTNIVYHLIDKRLILNQLQNALA